MAAPVIPLLLHQVRYLQGVAKSLVLHNGCLVDLWQAVITHIGQGGAVSTDLDAAVRIVKHIDVLANQGAVKGTSLHTTKFSPAGPMIFNGGRHESGMGSARTGRDRFGRCAA
jgi:hypothetical protein